MTATYQVSNNQDKVNLFLGKKPPGAQLLHPTVTMTMVLARYSYIVHD